MPLGDKQKQLGGLQTLARPAMEKIFKVLWPKKAASGNFFDLVRRLQEASDHIGAWKSLAAREGACQAWAMLQTHFPMLNIKPIVESDQWGQTGRSCHRMDASRR